MTDKRFRYEARNGGRIKDYGSDTEGAYAIYESLLYVTKLLNELYEENVSLKEENKFLQSKVLTYKKVNSMLKEQLL